MNISRIRQLKPFCFSTRDLAEKLDIAQASAVVTCHRYVKQKLFVRAARDTYVLAERLDKAETSDLFALANRVQVPSYISLGSALSFYEISTQVQQSFFESIAVTRTKTILVNTLQFQYTKIQKKLYFGFIKQNGFFIATPEKAFLDALYLMSIGRYKLDLASIDKNKLDIRMLKKLLKLFPTQTEEFFKKIWTH